MPKMSVIVVAGERRERVERNLACLAAQTALDLLEILVVDIAPSGGILKGTEHPAVRHLQRPDLDGMWAAMAEGARQARGEIVAFLEDHCFPSPEWAAAVIEAFRPPVAVVNYAFTDVQPQTYMSRAFLMAEYGRWMVPAKCGPITIAACNNIAYDRRILLRHGSPLNHWLSVEYLLHRKIRQHGGMIWLEPRAVVAHEDWYRFFDGTRANGALKRVHSATLVALHQWSTPRRLLYAAAMVIAPGLHLWRLARSLWNRPSLWLRFAAALPVSISVYCYSSLEEALGYLLGAGSSRRTFEHVELSLARKPE